MAGLYVAARLGLGAAGVRVAYAPHPSPAEDGLAGDVGMAFLIVALIRLTQMLGVIAGGELLSARVIRLFRGFAFWLLLMALVGFIGPLLVDLLSRRSGDAIRFILDLRQILTVGVTLVLFLLARLLERARRLEEEIREFV